jgi:hypothetical protein
MNPNGTQEGRSAAGYSSVVRLALRVNGCEHDLASIGPQAVRLRKPLSLPPCDAEVIMRVNGNERLWPVILSQGAVASDLEVAIVDR